MNISEIFIKRPIATSLLAIAILLAGTLAYMHLAIAPLPQIDVPSIAVSASLPGASPENMASSVATPLERRFGRIAGITEITSSSSLGSTSITLQFDLDRDIDAAARDVQAAINAAGGELPGNLPNVPTYRKLNPSDAPILVLALTSETMKLGEVYNIANSILAQRLSQLEGVGQVFIGGGQLPAIRIQVDPMLLASMNLTLEDIRKTITTANINNPKGSLQGAEQAYTIANHDQLYTAAGYADLLVNYVNNAPVRLKDIANVFDDVENSRTAAWHQGERSILMIIRRAPGANIIDTIARIKQELPKLQQAISPSIHIHTAVDRSKTIRASVADVQSTLILTVLLVVIVVFVFLRNVWATIIPSIAVPLSLFGTFGVMYLLDYSLDNLSLMALTISTGFVVDDAIVVTENVMRYLENKHKPLAAALHGSREISFTIVSITVSLLAVFIPILFMGGIVGRWFREFSVTLSVAVAVSGIVSLTVTPMMCAKFLHETKPTKPSYLYMLSERFFTAMVAGYGRGLRWAMHYRRLMLLLTCATIALTVLMFRVIPKGLFPQQDIGQIAGFSEASQDISFAAMHDKQMILNKILQADKDIASVNAFIGSTGPNSTSNNGTVIIDLKDKHLRSSTADEIIARLRPKIATVEGIHLYLQSNQDLRIGGRTGRTQYQYTLQDANLNILKTWAPKVLANFRKLPQLKDVATDQQTAGLQANLHIDRDIAASLGVSVAALDNTLYNAFGQAQISTIYNTLSQNRVVLEVLPIYQQDPSAFNMLYVRGNNYTLAPVSSFTQYFSSAAPLTINHQGQFPAVTLSFNLAPDAALGDAVKAIDATIDNMHMPSSTIAAFAGTAQAFGASSSSVPWLILAALVGVVYIVLGVLYESYIYPLVILSTLPSAGVGALITLYLCNKDFSVIALIGMILLIGIVKKNAIMIVDFALDKERNENMPADEAIYQACLLRFRPIMMTTMAALFGSLPMALGSGMGSELRAPLGIAIVGGLLVSQCLTLFTTPIVYLALHKFSRDTFKPYTTGA